MYCPNCGSEVMEDAKFCPSCGLEIKLPRDGDKDEASSNAKNSNASKASASGDANDGAANFINIWSSLSTAKKIVSIAAVCCIGLIIIGALLGAISPDKNSGVFDETNEGRNITLVKESTSGYAYISGGEEVYYYSLSGVLLNIPKDPTGFTFQTTFLDEDGKRVGKWGEMLDLLTYSTEHSDPTPIGFMTKRSLVNVSNVEIVVFNPRGEKVFNQTVEFDMEEFDLSRIEGNNKTVENSSD